MNQALDQVEISGEKLFCDALGVTTLSGKRYFTVASLIGRRSAMDYALPSIHKGDAIRYEKNLFFSIGPQRYMGKKGTLSDGILKTLIIPNQHLQIHNEEQDKKDGKDAENKMLSDIKTVFWYGEQDNTEDLLWNTLRQSPVPVLDTWKKPIIQILRDVSAIDELCAQNGAKASGQERIIPIDFVIGNTQWGGFSLHVSDDDMASAVQFLLRSKRIAA